MIYLISGLEIFLKITIGFLRYYSILDVEQQKYLHSLNYELNQINIIINHFNKNLEASKVQLKDNENTLLKIRLEYAAFIKYYYNREKIFLK